MLLTTRQEHQLRPLHLSLKDSHIEQVHEHRHVGVITDDEFSWRPHITGTRKTVSNDLYLLSQLRHFVDTPKRNPVLLVFMKAANSVFLRTSSAFMVLLFHPVFRRLPPHPPPPPPPPSRNTSNTNTDVCHEQLHSLRQQN